jgi:hypothetical protein
VVTAVKKKTIALPPTRNHRQLANWINAESLVDDRGHPVQARVDRITTNTDTMVAGTRFRRAGRGRRGLVLEIWLLNSSPLDPENRLYRHESSETYRRHSEARAWIEHHLRRPR